MKDNNKKSDPLLEKIDSYFLILDNMANLRQIKSKIKSVANLKKITRALEVVSTVKLQKTKQQAESLKDYLVDLLAILSHVGEKYDVYGSNGVNTSQKTLCIVVTSERGLCGGLNSKLLKKVRVEVGEDKQVDFFAVGKKGLEFLKRGKANIVGSIFLGDTYSESELLPLYSFFDQAIATGGYKEIKLYFNYFKNSMTQMPTRAHLYPFRQESFQKFITDIELTYHLEADVSQKDLLIEPDFSTYLAELRRQVRNYVISSAIVQNKTGEHASRMIAMKNATDNSSSLIKSLTLSFNKARQAAITQEISEIVSAKIAIEG